jgi:hypothetical protein
MVTDTSRRDGQPPQRGEHQPAGGDAYSGPFLRTWDQAMTAATHHQRHADLAAAALPTAQAALRAATGHLETLRGELARTRPWHRQHRAYLREQISQAENTADDHRHTVADLQTTLGWFTQLHHSATRLAVLLRHQEQAQPTGQQPTPAAMPRPASSTVSERPAPQRGGRTSGITTRSSGAQTRPAPFTYPPRPSSPWPRRPPGPAPRR